MKLEDLDTLLRNKLQLVSSETTPDELEGIMVGLGASKAKKKPKALLWLMGAGLLALIAGAGLYIFSGDNNKTVKQELTSKSHQSNTLINPTKNAQTKEKSIQEINKETIKVSNNSDINSSNQSFNNSTISNNTAKKPLSYKEEITTKKLDKVNSLNLAKENFDKNINKEKLRKGIPFTFKSFKIKPEQFNQSNVSLTYFASFQNVQYNPSKGKAKKTLSRYFNPTLSVWISAHNAKETVSVNEPQKVHKEYLNEYNNGIRNNWTINTGAKLQINMLRYFKLGTGLGYLNTGGAYDYNFKINDIPIEDSATGTILGYITKPDSSSSSVIKNSKYSASYLEIPISLSANILLTQKIRVGVEASLINQWLLNEKGESLNTTSLKLNSKGTFKPKIMSYELGFPITFNRDNRTSVTLTPYLGKAKNTVTQEININKNRNFSGIRLALNYNLIQL